MSVASCDPPAAGDPLAAGADAASFDPVWYLQAYPDVRQAGIDPWEHFLARGRAEGRLAAPVRALELDHLLWRGHAAMVLPALAALRAGADPREAALAGWALARWQVDQGDRAAARAALGGERGIAGAAHVLNHPGPFLLGAQLALGQGDTAGARALLRAGSRRFGLLPDFLLGELLCRKALGAGPGDLNDLLAGIYLPQGLLPVEILDLPGPLFDRLGADCGPLRPAAPAGQPLVSVILPVFNGAAVLPAALRGLRAQTWQNLEILVVDDGSSDDTLALARAAARQDARIRVLAQGRNLGAYPARNAGFAAARGAFITVHDADDWSHPQKIALQVRPLTEEPALQATVSHWLRVGNDLEMARWRMEERWVYRNVSSLMLRAELRDGLGYWDRVRVNADTEYYYRILAAHGAHAIREVLPGVPLAFGRSDPRSLTLSSATHLRSQFRGARRDYMEAAHAWHREAAEAGGSLHLPQFPAQRPFRAPPSLSLGDPDPPPAAFDILTQSPLFDADWYGFSHPDVLRQDMNPVRHYLDSGGRENRDPGPGFSSGGYRQAMRLPPGENPLLHYETRGRALGASPLPRFAGLLAPRLAAGLAPCHLVFAHAAGKTLFGAERSLLDVLERMAQRGDSPVVVLPGLQNMAYLDQILERSAAVELVPQLWRHALRKPHPLTLARITALIRQYRPQEVHVNTLVLDAPLAAARQEGIPGVVHVRELPEGDRALQQALGLDAASLRARLLAEADRFVVASALVADWLDCPGRTELRPNAVDPRLFALPFAPGAQLRVAIISSNIAKKGLADFLTMAQSVADEGRAVRFRIIGPPTQDLHLMRPWPANVEFAGYADSPLQAMEQADVVMSLSKFSESFGRTVLEAMAAGRPVVCYDRGAPPTLVQSGISGFVVPADDPQAAARAVLAFDAARGQLRLFSQAARRRAQELQDQATRP